MQTDSPRPGHDPFDAVCVRYMHVGQQLTCLSDHLSHRVAPIERVRNAVQVGKVLRAVASQQLDGRHGSLEEVADHFEESFPTMVR